MSKLTRLVIALPFLFAACAGQPASAPQLPSMPEPVGDSAHPEMAPTQWKERLRVLYVYLDCTGDYRALGDSMSSLLEKAKQAGAKPAGAPFALFYDDPATTPVDQLRSRLCIPVADVPPRAILSYDVLPSAMVVYSTVRGAYPQLPKVYPTLLNYMASKNWTPSGPIREIYLSDPSSVESYAELVAEVQIPWRSLR